MEVACALVREGGDVQLLHVASEGPVAAAHAGEPPRSPRFRRDDDAERRIESHLADLVPPDTTLRGVRTEILVAWGGDPAEEISRAAAVLGADAVVLGTRGTGRARRGSVSSAVVRSSSTPVFLLDPGPPAGRALTLPPRAILCVADLSRRGRDRVAVALALAGEDSTVHLLHVQRPANRDSTGAVEDVSAARWAARRALLAVVREEASRDVRTQIHVVEGHEPEGAVDRYADALRADLVVLSGGDRTDPWARPAGAIREAVEGGTPVVWVPSLCEGEE